MNRPLPNAQGLSARFARARGGNIAIWTAAALLPIALLVGAATDVRRVELARSRVQDAADAAALAAAKTYVGGGGDDPASRRRAEAAAAGAFAANLEGVGDQIGNLNWSLQRRGHEVTLVARATAPAAFAGLFGMAQLPLRVSSSAAAGMRRVEVALVLDNTGSMSGKKIDTLRVAAADLVDRLAEVAASSGDKDAVKLALVPFSMTVRVPAEQQGASWVDRDAKSSIHQGVFPAAVNRLELFEAAGETWAGCVESRPYPHDVREDPPSSAAARSTPCAKSATAF